MPCTFFRRRPIIVLGLLRGRYCWTDPLSRLAGQVNEVPGSRVHRSETGAVRAISHRQTRQEVGTGLTLVRPCPCRAVLGREANGRPAEPPADSACFGTPDQPTPRLGLLGTWAGPSLPASALPLPSAASPPPGTWHPAKPHPAPTPGIRTTAPPSYKPCGSRCPLRPRPLGPASHARTRTRTHTHAPLSPFALADLSGPSSSQAPE